MRFALTIAADAIPEGWIEKHEFEEASTIDQARPLAEHMVAHFNATLRPGEQPRRLLSIDLTPETEEEREDREMREAALFSDCPEGCCPACWHLKLEVQMEYNERWDRTSAPNVVTPENYEPHHSNRLWKTETSNGLRGEGPLHRQAVQGAA
jgi:hypothetical protein